MVLLTKTFKAQIDNRLHSAMREITKRKRPSSRKSIGEQYEAAMEEFLRVERIPKQVEKITRTQVRLRVTHEFMKMAESIRLIARKNRKPFHVVLEEIIESYIAKPENYLGKPFYEQHKRKIERIS